MACTRTPYRNLAKERIDQNVKNELRHRMQKPSRGKFAAKSLAAAAALTLPFLGFAAPANADNGGTWDQLAECESGGNWNIDTGNGYRGGLQFSQSTWEAYGGSGNPANASRDQQIAVAENVLDGQGWGAWPACSAELGLSGNAQPSGGSGEQTQQQTAQQPQQQRSQQQAPAEEPAQSQPVQPQAQAAPQQQAAPTGQTYTVVAGDTLSKIAKAHNVHGGWQAIYEANAATIADPVLIYPGQQILIP